MTSKQPCPTCNGTGVTDGALGFNGEGPCPKCAPVSVAGNPRTCQLCRGPADTEVVGLELCAGCVADIDKRLSEVETKVIEIPCPFCYGGECVCAEGD